MNTGPELTTLIVDVADALVAIDRSGAPFKTFRPGVGPYGEPQLVRAIAEKLSSIARYAGRVTCKRTPDLLVKDGWALEFKIARPFGDNGKEAENWSVNLLHPYEGNVSALGDCLKLGRLPSSERKAVVVIGYEHTPPIIALDPLFLAFETIAHSVMRIKLRPRVQVSKSGLIHPIHQQLTVVAWELERPAG